MTRRQIPLKAVAKVVNGFPFPSAGFDAAGHPLVRIRDISATATETKFNGPWEPKAAIDTGDVLVGMDGDFNLATWKGGPALLNQRVCCIRGKSSEWTRFLAYYLPPQLQAINDVTYATTVKHLASGDIERIAVPALEPFELDELLRYLDAKTAAIDALIAKKELLIEELKKYQEAIIAEAVKPREGWAKAKVKGIAAPLPKSARPAGEAIDGGPYAFYVSGQQVKACEKPDYVDAEAVVLATGGGPAVHHAFGSFSFSTDCWALVAKSEGHTGFLYYLLVNMKAGLAELGFRGAGIKHLDKDWLLTSVVAVPAKSEQAAIAASLTKRIAGIRKLVESAETVIADARKLRASLISEAVTGKLKLSD